MYLQKIGKHEGLKKFTSCFLIVLIGILGFPFSVFSEPNPDTTQPRPSKVKVTPIEPDKGVVASDSVQDSSVNASKEHFAIIEEFKIDKGFWFTLFSISELSKKEKGNNQTAFNATPIAFSFTGSGISPTYTIINKGAKVQTVNRDNLTGKLSLADGKSILIEALNQKLSKSLKNDEIRQGEWEDNVNISVEEYTGIRSFEVPVRFKTEPINGDKSLFRITFESDSFNFSLKSNSSITQRFNGFVILGANDKKVYFSVFRYVGDCFQYENGHQSDHFVGQQIGYLTNSENGKALLDSIDKGGFNQLLMGYPMINLSSGSFRDEESSPPLWMGKVLGMSRLVQAKTVASVEKSTDFVPVSSVLGGYIVDGLLAIGLNTSFVLRDWAAGKPMSFQGGEIMSRLLDSKVSFVRSLYDPVKPSKGWVGVGEKIGLVDPGMFQSCSRIGGELLQLPGDWFVVSKESGGIFLRTKKGKNSGIDESLSRMAGNLEQICQKSLWGNNPFGRSTLFKDGYNFYSKTSSQDRHKNEVKETVTTEDFQNNQITNNLENGKSEIEHFLTSDEFKTDSGFWYTIISLADMARQSLANDQTVYKFTPKGFTVSGSGISPFSTVFKKVKKTLSVIRDNITEKLNSPDGNTIFVEEINNTLDLLSKNKSIRKGEWKESINVFSQAGRVEDKLIIPVNFKVEPFGNKKEYLLISFNSYPFEYSIDLNRKVSQKVSGFAILGNDKKNTYYSFYRYEGDVLDNGIKIDKFVGQQFIYMVDSNFKNPILMTSKAKSLAKLLDSCYTINNVPGSFDDKIITPPDWVASVLGISRLIDSNVVTIAEQRTNLLPIVVIWLVVHVIDGYLTFVQNVYSLSEDITSGKLKPSEITTKNIFLRLTNDDASLLNRFLYNPVSKRAITSLAQLGWIDPNQTELYSDGLAGLLKLPADIGLLVTSPQKAFGASAYGSLFKKGANKFLGRLLYCEEKIWKTMKIKKIMELYDIADTGHSGISDIIRILAAATGGGLLSGLLLKGKSGSDVTGAWTLNATFNSGGWGTRAIRADINLKSDGTVYWIPTVGPISSTSGSYTVNDDSIRIELVVHFINSEDELHAAQYYTLTGEVYDKKNMGGDAKVKYDWLDGHTYENYSGTWSATRK